MVFIFWIVKIIFALILFRESPLECNISSYRFSIFLELLTYTCDDLKPHHTVLERNLFFVSDFFVSSFWSILLSFLLNFLHSRIVWIYQFFSSRSDEECVHAVLKSLSPANFLYFWCVLESGGIILYLLFSFLRIVVNGLEEFGSLYIWIFKIFP